MKLMVQNTSCYMHVYKIILLLKKLPFKGIMYFLVSSLTLNHPIKLTIIVFSFVDIKIMTSQKLHHETSVLKALNLTSRKTMLIILLRRKGKSHTC